MNQWKVFVYNIIEIFYDIKNIFVGLLASFVDFCYAVIYMLVPLLAPLPTAYAIHKALVEVLGMPGNWALIGALVVEFAGMSNANVTLIAFQWNRNKTQKDKPLPFEISIASSIAFFAVIFILAAAIEIWPELSKLLMPGFVIMAICTYVNIGIRTMHKDMLADKKEAKSKRITRPKPRILPGQDTGQNTDTNDAHVDNKGGQNGQNDSISRLNATRQEEAELRKQLVLTTYNDRPEITKTEMSQILKNEGFKYHSTSTIKGTLSELRKEGQLPNTTNGSVK